ncbi:IS3 family transposase [Mechercharimyces sp. CAU 1602]|uniref:IS3 family transposase n=1 Tax=Mechercharimyces sp. CAU 1602 TaxID=2973933 RepID=UPI00216269FB|nr:IS3 family transposase [Mechercharimyces sp. CAU 1602]MCS1352415.1 IS3 family transposase [Mechercharimyces sp. CAU 1602]
MERKTNGKYNWEFKEMVVELYQSGQSVRKLSSEYGLSEVTIYKWIKAFTPIEGTGEEKMTPADYQQMKKEMLKLKEENEIPKKGYGHIRKKVADKEVLTAIQEIKKQHPVQMVCETLDVPRSTYYRSLNQKPSSRDRENQKLKRMILEIYRKSKQRYGAPKIHRMLFNQGLSLSLKRVQRLMRKMGIFSITHKKFRPYSKKTSIQERTNLLKRDFTTMGLNQKWVSDLTYVHTSQDGWCYLASVMDLHSKKIVGYSFSRRMTTEVVMKAIKNACLSQPTAPGLILHSDLGSQYTSEELTQFLQQKDIQQSFSANGCPYDNACIESFHAILKKEEVHHRCYRDFDEAKVAIFQFIEGWYNRNRVHSGLDYLTPQTVEDQLNQSLSA